jgi:hypothetical protein
MIYADKENLKTHVAQEILLVREKEMKFYTRNLSMLGTHAALLAGFAFTILSQHEFKVPQQGFLAYETERSLTMWTDYTYIEPHLQNIQGGMGVWPWHIWFQQVFQLFHLCFTAMGILLHLWTVYTTVVTNILGIGLALRGPEGSVDRAVRHMAQQCSFALRKFILGLILFILSLIFFALSEYHLFIGAIVVSCIVVLSFMTISHISELSKIFYLGEEDTITGQWLGLDERANQAAGGRNSQTGARAVRKGKNGLMGLGSMVSGKYSAEAEASMRRMTGKKPSGPAGHLKAAVGTVAERLNLNPQATLRKGFNNIVEVQPRTGEEQAPSRVAERLIINQQAGAQTQPPSPALRRQRTSRRLWRQASSGRFSRSGPENGANGLPKRDEVARALESALAKQRRENAATALQSRARGSLGRQRTREMRCSHERESATTPTQGGDGHPDGEEVGVGAVFNSLLDKMGIGAGQLPWDEQAAANRESSTTQSPAEGPSFTRAHAPGGGRHVSISREVSRSAF